MEANCNSNKNLYSLENKCERPQLTFETRVDYLEIVDCENIYLRISKKDCQIRRDIEVEVKKYNRIYGTVYDRCKTPVEKVVVNLIKYENTCGVLEKRVVEYSITDEIGGYNFLVPKDCDTSQYKIEIDCIID